MQLSPRHEPIAAAGMLIIGGGATIAAVALGAPGAGAFAAAGWSTAAFAWASVFRRIGQAPE
jgi:hypothetical protein